jgi:hypothetical protein
MHHLDRGLNEYSALSGLGSHRRAIPGATLRLPLAIECRAFGATVRVRISVASNTPYDSTELAVGFIFASGWTNIGATLGSGDTKCKEGFSSSLFLFL